MILGAMFLSFKVLFSFVHLQTAMECQSFYPHYKLGFDDTDLDCQAVVLFYRIRKMIDLTCSALRQQITNTEQRRLEKEIKVKFLVERNILKP